MIQTDILVLGTGISGLSFAIKSAEKFSKKKVLILSKTEIVETNTKYAQGGIAAVLKKEDSFSSHIEDTMRAGQYRNNREVVEFVVKEAPARIKELIQWGVEFDKNQQDLYDMAREGGHSSHRILHHKDITGYEIERALIAKVKALKNVSLIENCFVLDLITDHHFGIETKLDNKNNCYGAYALNTITGEIETIASKITMIATGGAGQVYEHTTNPIIATGDGIAIAYRAKAIVADMDFIQFHPSSLYQPDVSPSFLISEAVRGFGGHVKNAKKERFLFKYDDRGELASRDVVSKAIDDELNKSGEKHVYIDCTHLNKKAFIKHFPNIYDKCLSIGIDIEKDMIPIVPAAHYTCGGINIDKNGKTNIKNLYACGECTRSGLHGANRLASNSLLEALVFSHRSVKYLDDNLEKTTFKEGIPLWYNKGTTQPKELVLITHSRKELQTIMSDYMAIVRSEERTKRALRRLEIHFNETEELYNNTKISAQLCELRNLIINAYSIVKQSMKRGKLKS